MKFRSINYPRIPVGLGRATMGAFLGACLLLYLNLVGCSSSTDPQVDPGDDPGFVFSPIGQGQEIRLSETMRFSVGVQPAAGFSASWYQQGLLVGQDSVLNYVPARVGRDTLGVRAFSGAAQDTYYWEINVLPDPNSLPPEVTGISIEAGPQPAEVRLSWQWVNNSTFPLAKYLVAVSYIGPINEFNWDQATLIGSYDPEPGLVFYSKVYNEADDGMRPGERAWFCVRVRDDRDQLSAPSTSVRHDITWPWYLGGLVTDDVGLPIPVVGVTTGDYDDNTDGRGIFLFDEAFRSVDSVRVATTSAPYFNFTTSPVSVLDDTTLVNITLVNRYELENIDCWTGSFLEYLRDMTRTVTVPGVPAESQLFTWSEYPVSVFIPPGVENLASVDMEAACLAALEFWNTTMRNDALALGIIETDYFVQTSDEATAGIVFLFEYRGINYGEASLLLPTGHALGEVIPEKVEIWINTTDALNLFEEVQGVALHEFGHTLGLINHSDCPGPEYLMKPGGGAAAMGRAEPIHLDERRAIRAVRNIPQGINMSGFSAGTGGFN